MTINKWALWAFNMIIYGIVFIKYRARLKEIGKLESENHRIKFLNSNLKIDNIAHERELKQLKGDHSKWQN